MATNAARPTALSRPLTPAAGNLDLQLTGGDVRDTIDALFYPIDPIIPGNPVVPTYDRTANVFAVNFSAASTPSVTALSGTVFAAITSYYFRGFGIPLDAGLMNVAKAGRAIPLKWQVYDYVVQPVLDLDPAVVKLSSVVIPCEGSGVPTDVITDYEYAVGASGLQNQGDGMYQLNWGTSKAYAGTCRRLRLDLGERNPDGTVFYRTADFHFTK